MPVPQPCLRNKCPVKVPSPDDWGLHPSLSPAQRPSTNDSGQQAKEQGSKVKTYKRSQATSGMTVHNESLRKQDDFLKIIDLKALAIHLQSTCF